MVPFSWFGEGTFSERIRKARVEKGFTQTALAKEAGLSVDLLYRWERERHGASSRNLRRVSAILGVSSHYLLTGARALTKKGAPPGEGASACVP